MTFDWLTQRPIAHRGLHDVKKNIAENSLTAFYEAADHNFPIMLDACLTKDGVVIVYHDHLSVSSSNPKIIDGLAKDVVGQKITDSNDVIQSLEYVLEKLQGRTAVLVNLHGNPPHFDTGLATSTSDLLRHYGNNAAMLAGEVHLLRRFPVSAEGVTHGMRASGIQRAAIETNFSMLAHDIQFVLYNKDELPNAFVRFMRQRLRIPILAGVIKNKEQWLTVDKLADQMVFEGFNPDSIE